jgi:hypothetical protein
MLPNDAKARRREALEKAMEQTQVSDHFQVVKPEDKPEAYSDDVFKEATLRWLIETDQVSGTLLTTNIVVIVLISFYPLQPIIALEYPSFQRMMHLASRSTRGISLLNKKQTRDSIVSLFKAQMKALKQRLNVRIILFLLSPYLVHLKGKYVAGNISLTCDAWQASNADGYFAATGHWIEERSPGKWTLEHTLLGFVQMNTAHNGKRLGQVLFKICDRLGIVHKARNYFFRVVIIGILYH